MAAILSRPWSIKYIFMFPKKKKMNSAQQGLMTIQFINKYMDHKGRKR